MLDTNKEHYDFSCWVIKYGCISILGKTYQKDSLKSSDGLIVPLLWQHQHNDPMLVLGHALLENRDEGIYAYCTLSDNHTNEITIQLIRDRGSVSLSPYITQVKTDEKTITHGMIREVSLVLARNERALVTTTRALLFTSKWLVYYFRYQV